MIILMVRIIIIIIITLMIMMMMMRLMMIMTMMLTITMISVYRALNTSLYAPYRNIITPVILFRIAHKQRMHISTPCGAFHGCAILQTLSMLQ